jgi:cation diffusion facilitator family transporter
MDNDVMLKSLKRLVDSALYSLIPLALTLLTAAILSNSLTVLSMTADYGLSLVVHLFSHQSIRAMIKSNVIKFPFGTGKLENFSAFLYGSLTTPMGLYILYTAVCRLAAPPQSISFTYVQLAMIPAIARALYLFIRARRLNNQTDSPMAESYYVNFKVTTLFAVGVLLAFTSAVILTCAGHASVAGYIDPMVSLILSLYMLYNGVKQTVGNFKILMDLPLPEDEQLKIMNVITCEFDNYENVGNIYTRRSGRQRFLDIELYLDENMTIRETACLQSRMQGHLEEYFDGIKFKLIPLPHSQKAGH